MFLCRQTKRHLERRHGPTSDQEGLTMLTLRLTEPRDLTS
jgi:hypothetical protein